MLLRSRTVLPISRPRIDDGAVRIDGDRITAVGAWRELAPHHTGEVTDLGDAILLPGLINAHCHLDYTDMAGLIPPPKIFSDWIKSIVALKANWSYTDFAESWLNGAGQLLRHGVTTVVDIEAVPELLPEVWHDTPLRVLSCLELISIKSRLAARELVEQAAAKAASLNDPLKSAALSPHAPYTTSPELVRLAADISRQRRWPLTMHVAESAEEFAMFTQRAGPLHDWLRPQRDMSDCTGASPVQWLEQHGALAENFLAVHVNHLAEGDAALLARRRVSVVHCPRSHAYFAHARFPLDALQQAGVNIYLGTDSLASVRKQRNEPLELDLFAEMRSFAESEPAWSPEAILQLATVNAARALGRSGELGELCAGAAADLVAIPGSAGAADPFTQVLAHRGPVTALMIAGKWVWKS